MNPLPLYLAPVAAGFPSPADDYVERALDLNEHLIRHPAATYFVRASGNSMINAGIHDGDLLVVDRSIAPSDNQVVIAIVSGDFTVKRLRKKGGKIFLCPENDAYPPIEVTEEADCSIWGVVLHSIHRLNPIQ